MHAVGVLSVMISTKRSPSVSLLIVVIVVVDSISRALSVPSTADKLPTPRHIDVRWPPTDSARRRRSTVDDVRAIFGGLEDADGLEKLTELASQDMAAAVLEYNEMVLTTATGNGSDSRTCWMRLNYNVTALPGGLSDLFRDQVTIARHGIISCSLTVFTCKNTYLATVIIYV